jgi:mono/diheme cytochrome c family protein
MRQGEAVYAANCAMCHQAQGQGGPRVVALRGDAKLQQANPVGILHVILAGVQRQSSATSAPAAMPAFGMKLSDEDAAAVATYVRNAWGNSAPAASASQVGALRRKLAAAAQAKAE